MSRKEKICNICKKNKAVYYRIIKDNQYYICESQKCNFLSLLRAGMMKLRDLNTNQR